ncbi:Lrp/AsnC family transcriptional regulator [Candidatus Woesearchaeota archaeon]|nr:Lrp/AsnC family transcriptional regulator [Candidatus Woesearchaeota archaeon]
MRKKDTSKDHLLVSLLRQDARQPIRTLGNAISMCRGTVAERLFSLQKEVIRKYTALVDFRKLGFGTRVLFTISLASEEKNIFGRYIRGHPALNNLYQTTNGADYIFEMIFCNHHEYSLFMEDIEYAFAIHSLTTSFIEQELVREAFVTSLPAGAS